MNCQRLRRERQKTIERKESYQTLTAPASWWMALGRTWTRIKGKKRMKKGNEGRRGATAMRRQCESTLNGMKKGRLPFDSDRSNKVITKFQKCCTVGVPIKHEAGDGLCKSRIIAIRLRVWALLALTSVLSLVHHVGKG